MSTASEDIISAMRQGGRQLAEWWPRTWRTPVYGQAKVAPLPYRRSIVRALQVWIGVRLAYIVVTYFALLLQAHGAQHLTRFGPHALMGAWNHWDANWYISIARLSYTDAPSTAFFPLYPLLISLVSHVVGMTHIVVVALLLANLGTLVAIWGLDLLATQELGPHTGLRTVLLALAYPLMFFTASAYTEGIFLAFATFTLLYTRRGAWRAAAVFAFLAALTRPTGIILILPMVWEYGCFLRRQSEGWSAALRRPRQAGTLLLLLAAVPAAVGVYALYLGLRFGHPLLFLSAQNIGWGRQSIGLFAGIRLALHNFRVTPAWTYEQALLLVDLLPLAIAAILTLVSIQRIPFGFSLYLFGLLYLCIASPSTDRADVFISSGRFLCEAVPLFLLLSMWAERRPWLETLLISSGFMLQALFLAFFLIGGNIV